jgi:Transcriptional regulatory protein, C terminal
MIARMTRAVFIAAAPRLAGLVAEQIEAQGYAPRMGAPEAMAPQGGDFPFDAAVLDADVCEAGALAARLREQGFGGAIVLIDAEAEDADAALARPVRIADLLAAFSAPPRQPRAGLRLTEKEAAILERLEQAQGAILPKAELLADVWGYGPNVATRTLETHIHRLRRKLDNSQNYPQTLATEDGGYRLIPRR